MRLKFSKDAHYRGKMVFLAGKVYEVEEKNGYAGRWLTRGAVKTTEPVTDAPKAPVASDKKEEQTGKDAGKKADPKALDL